MIQTIEAVYIFGNRADQPLDEASSTGDTEFFDTNDNACYFLPGTDPLPREPWEIVAPFDFSDLDSVANLIQRIDDVFGSLKAISAPIGMGDTGKTWRWSDVGSSQMPRAPPSYPTQTVSVGGTQQPLGGSVNYIRPFTQITEQLTWLHHYETVYLIVDNRELSSTGCPEHWPYFVPWLKGRCELVGPYQERTTAIHVPITQAKALDQVHFTWAGTFVLEAMCLVYPTINFALIDSDCVPTTLFEVAELVDLMVDQASRDALHMPAHLQSCS